MGLTADIVGFAGFPAEAMPFLAALRDHNDRDWFAANRDAYERAVREPGEAFAAAMAPRLSAITGQPMSGKLFRVHRDVRFSKDKRPYNAHLHIAFLPAMGPTACGSGFYLGLEPDRLVLGAGSFDFGGQIDAYRAEADRSGADLAKVLVGLAAEGYRLSEPELKRTPAPYAAGHAHADLLRRKSVTAWRDVEDRRRIESPAVMDLCGETFARLTPLHRWLTEAAGAD
jgi:uncharacterized protein (TIGR02453 family)